MKKSKYNLSYTHLTSFDMGELVPIGIRLVNIGDVWRMSSSALARFSPLLAPVMHPTHITIHHWFVPLRLIWDEFEDFITGGPDGTSAPVFPTITMPNSGAGGVVAGTLADYLGVPLGYNTDNTGYEVSALPFRAYGDIFNHFYRDEDLQTELTIDRTSGPDTTTNTTLQHACWEKDYLTSARPFAQKGAEVTLPLGTTAPVVANGEDVLMQGSDGDRNLFIQNTADSLHLASYAGTNSNVQFGSETGLETDLSGATAASITDFRLASATQRFMENMSRHGSRFIEYLRRLGVKSSDARLQLPEYLGGGKQTVQYSEVLQTAPTDFGESHVGQLRGHGIAAARSNRFVRFFEEPGYVISLAYVLPKTIYTQSMERHWNLRTKFDFFQPEMQFIGQQQILNKEVKANHVTPNGVFGYQDRFDEYRRAESRISGEFRTTALDYWHFGRELSGNPSLNGDFVQAVPTDNPFAAPDNDVLYLMVQHQIHAKSLVVRDPSPKIL